MKIHNQSQFLSRFVWLSCSAVVCGAFALAPAAHSEPSRRGIGMPRIGGAPGVVAGAPGVVAGAPGVVAGAPRTIGVPNFNGMPNTGGATSLMRSSRRRPRTRVSIGINPGGGLFNQGSANRGYRRPRHNYSSTIVLIPGYFGGYYGGGYGGGGDTIYIDDSTTIVNSPGYPGYPAPYNSPYYGSYYGAPYYGAPYYGYPAGYDSPYNYGNGNYYYNPYNTGYNDNYNYSLPANAYYNPAWDGNGYNGNAPNWNLPDADGYYYDPEGSYYGGMSASSKARRSAENRGADNRTNTDRTRRSVRDTRPNVATSQETGETANGPAWAGGAVWSASADGTPATVPTWPSDAASAAK